VTFPSITQTTRTAIAVVVITAAAPSVQGELLENIENGLSFAAFEGRLRLKLSGTLDLEAYNVDKPAPALVYTTNNFLLNPRLTVYLDAQFDSHLYWFVQARVDRGFDPSDADVEIRLDEYAIRITPSQHPAFPRIQAGKFATAVGNWARRHDSWDNPFIDAPLPYDGLLGIWDIRAPASVETLLYWGHVPFDGVRKFGDGYSDKRFRLPIIWGPNYASGFSLLGDLGKVQYAIEIKNAALSSRPESWDLTSNNFANPTFSGRVGFRPNVMWDFGISGSVGSYLQPEAAPTLPSGQSIGDYQQILIGQDVAFAWHHIQLWAEVFETRFQVPNVGNADLLSYYLEAKYKVTPQLFVAARWNQQLYGSVPFNGTTTGWGDDAWRVDAGLGYRFSAYLQLKLQCSFTHYHYDIQQGERLLAAQLTFRF
jgi:hypothetical protein